MNFRKIAGPIRLDANSGGTDREYALPPRAGGSACKVVQYMVKIYAGSAAAKVGFKIGHSPDGTVYAVHTNTSSATIPALPAVMVFDCVNSILGEFIHPIPVVGGTAGSDYVTVEVYEMRKPF